jgi:hypothetical protein
VIVILCSRLWVAGYAQTMRLYSLGGHSAASGAASLWHGPGRDCGRSRCYQRHRPDHQCGHSHLAPLSGSGGFYYQLHSADRHRAQFHPGRARVNDLPFKVAGWGLHRRPERPVAATQTRDDNAEQRVADRVQYKRGAYSSRSIDTAWRRTGGNCRRRPAWIRNLRGCNGTGTARCVCQARLRSDEWHFPSRRDAQAGSRPHHQHLRYRRSDERGDCRWSLGIERLWRRLPLSVPRDPTPFSLSSPPAIR